MSDNKNSSLNDEHKDKDKPFYDVSFDYQDDNHQHSSSQSTNKQMPNSNDESNFRSSSSDNSRSNAPEDINQSGFMLERSIRRVKNLFNELDDERPSDFNPYKSNPTQSYQKRSGQYDTDVNNKEKLRGSNEQSNDLNERSSSGKNINNSNSGSKRRYSANLPSPEEIAQERENRRKKRIEQLEGIDNEEEIENTFKPRRLQEFDEDIAFFTSNDSRENVSERNDPPDNTTKSTQDSSSDDWEYIYSTSEEASNEVNDDKSKDSDLDNIEIVTDEPQSAIDDVNASTNSLKDTSYAEHIEEPIPATDSDDNVELEEIDHEEALNESDSNFSQASDDGEIIIFSAGSSTVDLESDEIDIEDNNLIDAAALPSSSPIDSQEDVGYEEASENVALNEETINVEQTTIAEHYDESDEDDDLTESVTTTTFDEKSSSKQSKYALAGMTPKDKTFFGINVTFNVIGRLVLYLILIVLILGFLVGGIGLGYFANLVGNTEPPAPEVMAEQLNQYDQQSTLYYGNGEPIADVRADVVRTVASLDDVSQDIIDGFIATEDEYFTEHPGVVPKAVIRAALQTLLTGSGTGGSTITQQLVKQQLLSDDVTFFRKANEILLAMRVEQYFSKEEILTAYLNVSPFGRNNKGENIAGIAQAAEGIFGVSPNDVTLNQAAFLVGLPQDPYTYTPYTQEGQIRDNLQPGIDRMHEVLYRMYREQYITREEYDEAINYDITQDFLAGEPPEEERQSYLYQAIMNGAIERIMLLNIEADGVDWKQVWADDEWYNEYYFEAEEELRTGGYHVYSTIDREIYDQLQESARAYNDEIGVTYDGVYTDPETGEETYYVEPVQTGMVVIENQTGRVLGFVAGTDYENNQIDHAFQMRRSPGSTIKPLAVYGPAIEHDIITPATIIPDTAYVQEYPDGTTWEPTNYGNVVSGGAMSARTALVRSDNLPTVRIYEELLNQGVPIIDYLEKMGFNTVDSYTEEDTQNLAFSLGGVTTGPTVFEETRAFTTFANNGNYVDGYYIERIEDAYGNVIFQQNQEPVEVFSQDTNYLMIDMMRDTMTDGTGRTANENLEVPGDWIAKTGISENSKDIWVLASTPAVTVGSWIGYDSRYADYTIDVNDGFGLESVRSQIYWARIVNDLYDIRPEIFGTDQTFQQPDSVREQTILEQTGTLPGSIQVNGNTINLSQPTREELFKVSNPAPELTYNFLFGATEDEQLRFWNQILQTQQEQRRQEDNNNNNNNNNNGDTNDSPQESSGEDNDENSSEPDEEEEPTESSDTSETPLPEESSEGE